MSASLSRCEWCEEPLEKGDGSAVNPRSRVWVHRTCDVWAWHRASPEDLGRYLDKVMSP